MNAATDTLPKNSSFISSVSHSQYLVRLFAGSLVATVLLYLASRYLIYWHDWPTLSDSISNLTGGKTSLESSQNLKGMALILSYIIIFLVIALLFKKQAGRSLVSDAKTYKNLSYYIVRAAFWATFLIGFSDAIVSFLRVEELLIPIVGQELSDSLDQPMQRGLLLHYPLLALSLVIAWFSKSLGFIWLALLIVIAEFSIVITSFIFSYEQAFMGDLVRFWYAAFFLFASAYSLIENGHVRVDILYSHISNRKKAWVNALGSLLLGLPVCWTILHYGMGSAQSSLIAPILSFEVSPTGYGMYIKYLMAALLIVYAVSMAIIFVSYFLSSCAYLFNEPDADLPAGGEN